MEQQPPPVTAPPAEPPKRSSGVLAVLAIVLVGGSAVGVVFYQLSAGKEKPALDTGGFDIAQTLEGPKASRGPAAASPGSGSMMTIKTGMEGYVKIRDKAAEELQAAEALFRAKVRAAERIIENLSGEYMAKYPIYRKAGEDWNSHDDLHYLSNHYYRNRDPIFFLKRLAESPNFPDMVKKYAGQPVIQAFAKDAMKRVPGDTVSASMDYVNKEKVMKPIFDNVMNSLGIPNMSGGTAAGPPKVDAGAVMGNIMKNNPEAQKAMENSNAPSSVNNASGKPTR